MPPKDEAPKKNGFVTGLKTEWNLFWDTILGDDETADKEVADPTSLATKDPFITGKLESLSLEQIKAVAKALSSDRKTLHQRLEALNKEIEDNTALLENLQLVGGMPDDTVEKINELADLGQKLSERLDKIDQRLKLARAREDQIKNLSEVWITRNLL